MKNRYLIIAPCGNESTLYKTSWLRDKETKIFDVCLLYYHATVKNEQAKNDVEYFFHLKDFKYLMIHQLLTQTKPDLLDSYDYFFFLDDDIEINTTDINKMFLLTAGLDLWISQPSLTHDSFCSWPILKSKPNSLCRFMGEVEVMAPLFSKYGLEKCLETFNKNKSSWGFDAVWPKLLNYPKNKIAVFDCITMRHTKEVGGGELYEKINNTHRKEYEDIIKNYGAKEHSFFEYSRLEYSGIQNNRLPYLFNKLTEKLVYVKQGINDLGLSYRFKSRLAKIKSSFKKQ